MAPTYRAERDRGSKEFPEQLVVLRERWPLGVDHFGRRAVETDALLVGENGLAVDRRPSPPCSAVR